MEILMAQNSCHNFPEKSFKILLEMSKILKKKLSKIPKSSQNNFVFIPRAPFAE